jgi:hypothetical protein
LEKVYNNRFIIRIMFSSESNANANDSTPNANDSTPNADGWADADANTNCK